jgi:orotidine 5'-phosphate decarboxylase subfamily 1
MNRGQDHLILALDVERPADGMKLLSSLGGRLKYAKIGHQLYARGGLPFIRAIQDEGFDVFLDIKLHDIPNTVLMAVEALASLGLWALTLHCSGGRKMLEEAVKAKKRPVRPCIFLVLQCSRALIMTHGRRYLRDALCRMPCRDEPVSAGKRELTASSVPRWIFPWSGRQVKASLR